MPEYARGLGFSRDTRGKVLARACVDRNTQRLPTQNFTDNDIGNAFGVASGSQKKLVERLTLAPDGLSLRYSFTLTDPEFIDTPVSNEFRWHYRPDVAASTVECDLDAASRYLHE